MKGEEDSGEIQKYMEEKPGNEKYFHNVLCLSKAEGMDIKRK